MPGNVEAVQKPQREEILERLRRGRRDVEVLPNDFRGDPALESGGSHFGAPASVLDDLRDAGFGLFATATNHSLDYSIFGLLHAMTAMDARGLSYAGVGRNLEDAQRPTYHTHPHGTVAMLSCSATFARGQEASIQRPDMPGRPGLNPLRVMTVHEVTAEQLATVRQMAHQLELEKKRLGLIQLGFRFPPDAPDLVVVGDLLFREAARTALRTTPNKYDVDGIVRWVRGARLSADLVLVSVHAHEEEAADKEQPAEFLPAFAHRMIDEGADLVVGHGPHLLRGIELYRGKPVFYSLSNFIGQNELVPRLPSDSYERFRADPAATPGEVYRMRTEDDRKGFPSDRRFWETVVPVCTFEDGKLAVVEIHPVGLGLGEPRHRRGRPRLAQDEEAGGILSRLQNLSEPFGTELLVSGSKASLRLPAPGSSMTLSRRHVLQSGLATTATLAASAVRSQTARVLRFVPQADLACLKGSWFGWASGEVAIGNIQRCRLV